MPDPKTVTVPDDVQRASRAEQKTMALDLMAAYVEEQDQVGRLIERAGNEGWDFDKLQGELSDILAY